MRVLFVENISEPTINIQKKVLTVSYTYRILRIVLVDRLDSDMSVVVS